MIDQPTDTPEVYERLVQQCMEIGFDMPSDIQMGALLKTLVASKPAGHFLELGTGAGLSLAWMVDGMCPKSALVSVDNDSRLVELVSGFFENHERVRVVCADGGDWIKAYGGAPFDLIFADAWPGKYSMLNETLKLLKPGGLYVIDDMSPQPNWPEGHDLKAEALVSELDGRNDLHLTKMNWSTGVIIATRR